MFRSKFKSEVVHQSCAKTHRPRKLGSQLGNDPIYRQLLRLRESHLNVTPRPYPPHRNGIQVEPEDTSESTSVLCKYKEVIFLDFIHYILRKAYNKMCENYNSLSWE